MYTTKIQPTPRYCVVLSSKRRGEKSDTTPGSATLVRKYVYVYILHASQTRRGHISCDMCVCVCWWRMQITYKSTRPLRSAANGRARNPSCGQTRARSERGHCIHIHVQHIFYIYACNNMRRKRRRRRTGSVAKNATRRSSANVVWRRLTASLVLAG